MKRRDSASVVDKDGNESNARLHEELVEGVDDSEFRLKTMKALRAKGVPEHVLKSLFSDIYDR